MTRPACRMCEDEFPRIALPIVECSRITTHSLWSRLDGLRRIDSGTATLPTSCMRLACRISSTSPGGSFKPRAMTAQYSLIR